PFPLLPLGGGGFDLLGVHRLGRVDPLVHEGEKLLAQIKRPGVVAEVHGVQPSDGPLPGGMRDRVQVTYPSVRRPDAGSLVRFPGQTSSSRASRRPEASRPTTPVTRARSSTTPWYRGVHSTIT